MVHTKGKMLNVLVSRWLEKWIFNTLSYCRSIARASFAVAVIFLETVEFMQSFMRLSFITQFKIFYYHLPVVETCLKKWLLGPFVQNQGTFFDFQKRAGEAFPSPLVACLWMRLNVHQYSWIISLNVLENVWINSWICQGSKYAWSSYMFDSLLRMTWILNVPCFWICVWVYVHAKVTQNSEYDWI